MEPILTLLFHTNKLHPHDPWPIPAPRHSHAPTLFPIWNSNSHITCILPTHNFHLKYSSLCMLLCSNSDPASTYCNILSHHHPCIFNITDLTSLFLLILQCFVSKIKC